ncbi:MULTISPECIES: ATP-binding protein [Streptomyces]
MTSSQGDVRDARRAATAFVAGEWPSADLGALALVVSELVTNAVCHAGGWWRLTVRRDGQGFVVDVADHSVALPSLRPRRLDAVGGRGLSIVRQLFGPLEILTEAQGKTVRVRWACG